MNSAVLLRVLEYYEGILILTTNRMKDTAFAHCYCYGLIHVASFTASKDTCHAANWT